MSQKLRLMIVSTHPAQTHVDLYRHLAESELIDVDVLYLRDTSGGLHDHEFGRKITWDIDLLSGYSNSSLTTSAGLSLPIGGVKNSRLPVPTPRTLLETWRHIVHRSPDVVLLPGHGDFWYLSVWLMCLLLRKPYILRGEGILKPSRKAVRAWISRILAKALVQRAAVFCYIGIVNYYFGLTHGARRFEFSPYCINTARFQSARLDRDTQASRRASLGLDPDIPVVVFSGKLQNWKRPDDVIRAVSQASRPLQALIIGDGPMLDDLQRLASHLGVRAHFTGFVNQAHLPDWYALGDIIVLPSGRGGDTWGLVINEALALGLSPAVSDAVPSWPDLAWGAGRVFRSGNTDELSQCIVELAELRSDARHHSALDTLNQRYSVEVAAQGIEAATHGAVHSQRFAVA